MTWLGLLLVGAGAVAPLLGGLDAAVAAWLEAWRTCAGEQAFLTVSDVLRPLGLTLVGAALLWRWASGRSLRPAGEAILALAAGSALVEALKLAVDRARPGAEFLATVGHSFPSGHTGNAVVFGATIVCLVLGRERARRSVAGLAAVVAVVAVVAVARLHVGAHWASDVIGTALLLGGYAVLALLHPDDGVRRRTIVAGALASALVAAIGAAGWRLELPTGGAASTAPATWRMAFGSALEAGRLRGGWTPDGPDPHRSSAWMTSSAGDLVLGDAGTAAGELRIVARPHPEGGSATCRFLRVGLNGVPLGERLLHTGWRAYVFALAPGRLHGGTDVLDLEVVNARHDGRRPGAPLAAFSELTLHAAGAPTPAPPAVRRGS